MQISNSQGVAIELANSGKVSGKRYFTNTIGCSNKWSIVQTPSGLYFMDSNHKDIHLFNGQQFTNLSQQHGFNAWSKNNIDLSVWTSDWNNSNSNSFVTYYDKKNQEVLFINSDIALAYSERIGEFTSFYNYGGTPYFCNLDDIGIWLGQKKVTANPADTNYYLWQHHAGDYCKFFEQNYPYSMTLVGNPDAHMDKVFTNLEFRACVDKDAEESTEPQGTKKLTPTLPFDTLEAWNEYQHGILDFKNINSYKSMYHHMKEEHSTLKRKFRLWACDIPRDNYPVPEEDNVRNIHRLSKHQFDRMRNPWVYLKLVKDAAGDNLSLNRAEIHDMMMTYWM